MTYAIQEVSLLWAKATLAHAEAVARNDDSAVQAASEECSRLHHLLYDLCWLKAKQICCK